MSRIARGGRRLLLLLALAIALACRSDAEQGAAAEAPAPRGEPAVVLVSLDGTRPADVSGLPTFERLAREGARADVLIPVHPSNTFPNHVTLVTGVVPDRHGIVNNVFRDPERGLHRYENDPSWLEAEPLWSLLAGVGIPSASFHWVGSEGPWRSGRGPRHWERFDPGVPERVKVDRILAWLAIADPAERPRFVTAWFPGADRDGHRHGPGSAQARAALRRQDRELGRLLDGVDLRATTLSWSPTTGWRASSATWTSRARCATPASRPT